MLWHVRVCLRYLIDVHVCVAPFYVCVCISAHLYLYLHLYFRTLVAAASQVCALSPPRCSREAPFASHGHRILFIFASHGHRTQWNAQDKSKI